MNNNRRDAPSSLDPARKRGISNDCARSPTQQFSLTRRRRNDFALQNKVDYREEPNAAGGLKLCKKRSQ